MIVDTNRYFLTILIWALILELITLKHYISTTEHKHHFLMLVMLIIMTIGGIIIIIRHIRKELKS